MKKAQSIAHDIEFDTEPPVKMSFFQTLKHNTLTSLGTTITGVSLNYDIVIEGITTQDYIKVAKGTIQILAFCLCKDPTQNNNPYP